MFTEPTLAQKLVDTLLALGCYEIYGTSKIWRVFSHDSIIGKRFFISKTGLLRAGTCVHDSCPSYLEKARLLKAWDSFQEAIILKKASNQ